VALAWRHAGIVHNTPISYANGIATNAAGGDKMKTMLLALVTLLLLSYQLAAAEHNGKDEDVAQAEGQISADALLAQYPLFAAEYAAYTVSAADIALMQSLHDASLLVLFGSWCSDSQREVPRLLKLLKQSGVALKSLQLEAVNRQKIHPDGLHDSYNLRFTPTIIVLRDGKELGRIIEQPQQSLAEDLAGIVRNSDVTALSVSKI
jgi:thioredoxin 1